MKNCDLNTGSAKLEMTLKSLRTAAATVSEQWSDQAHRDFEETYLATAEPNVRDVLDAVKRLAEVLSSAERQCNSY